MLQVFRFGICQICHDCSPAVTSAAPSDAKAAASNLANPLEMI
jgi:hypothetical protein